MYQHARWARFADGPDEVHQMRIAQRTIAAYRDTGSTRTATGRLTSDADVDRFWVDVDPALATEITAAGKVYRDSQGRMRTERSTSPDTVTVEILDPAAGARYLLDAVAKVAYRIELPRPPALKTAAARSEMASDAPAATAAAEVQQVTVEPLGKRVMDGIEASGQRMMNTILPGAESNAGLKTIVTEMWVSQQLGVTLASRVVDPRMGETTYRLRNITLREPDAALFQVPAEYKIVEEGASSSLPLN